MNGIVKWLLVAGGGLVGLAGTGFLVSYWASAGQYVVAATTADDPALPSRNIGGYRYHLEVFGLPTRPVVLVLHGGPGGDYRYLLPLKALSDVYQVVFYDRRGTGLSPRVPDEELGFEPALEDLHAVAEAVSPHEPVRLVGHSWGAMLAAAYVERHPERVSHAVLAEPEFLRAEQGRAWLAAVNEGRPGWSWGFASGAWRSLMQSLYVYGPDADARRDFVGQAVAELDVPVAPVASSSCDAAASRAELPRWRFGARAGDAMLDAVMDADGKVTKDIMGPAIERFPHKVLLVASSCNGVLGVDAQRQNLKLFGEAELAIIDDAGHTMFGDRLDASLSVLRPYLAEAHTAVVASE